MSAQSRLGLLDPAVGIPSTITLRDYQQEALEAILSAPVQGHNRVLAAMPTGSGKTIVFASVITCRPGRALVLAHRDELISQAADKIRMVMPGADVGIVKAQRNESDAAIVVASVQSLSAKRLATLGRFETVVVDECHHAPASSYGRILSVLGAFETTGAPLTLGVTATPERGDKLALGRVFQKIVFRRSLVWMIAKGYLSDVRAVQVHLKADFDALQVRKGDYIDSEVSDMLSEAHAPEMAARAYLEHAAGRRALIFTPTVALAYEMAEEFRKQGISAEGLDGTTHPDERRAILARLRSGETAAVANCGCLTEGYDEPAVDCIVVAKPTRSRGLYCQMVGRSLRLFPGKTDALIIDLVGSTTRHDLVTSATLLGLDPKPRGLSLMQAATERSAFGQEVRDELGELVTVKVELFRKLTWVQLAGGRWTLSVPDGRIDLAGSESGWNVVRYPKGQPRKLLAEGVTLAWAQGIAEEEVRSEGAEWLTDPGAPWRKRPAKPKQVAILQRKGLWVEGMTAGEASDVLTRIFAGR
jgi:superfamily II DNA or RNA helicase